MEFPTSTPKQESKPESKPAPKPESKPELTLGDILKYGVPGLISPSITIPMNDPYNPYLTYGRSR